LITVLLALAGLASAQSPTSNGGDPLFCQPNEGATFLIINGGQGLFRVDSDCYNSNIGTPPSNTPPPTITTTQGGTLTLNLIGQAANYTYTPPTPNFVGLDTFTIHLTTTWNAQGGPGSAGGTLLARPGGPDDVVVTLNVLPATSVLQVAGVAKVAPIPTGSVTGCPANQGNAGQGPAPGVVGGCVTGLALAPFNEQTSITTAHGSVTTVGFGTGQTIRYTPTAGYTGPDSFFYNIFGTNTDGSTQLNAGTGAVPAASPGNPQMLVTVSAPIVITNASPMPNGIVGTAYPAQTFAATGGFPIGAPTYTFSLAAGALPPGMTLTNGVLSGTPTTAGTFNFTIQAADGATDGAPNKVTKAFSIVVMNPTSTTVAPSTLPTYAQPVTFTATVTSGGGIPTGSVTFIDTTTSTTLASNVPLNGSGQASVTTSTLAAGGHTIQASYNATGLFAASIGTASFTVSKVVVTVTANNLTKVYGAAVPGLTYGITGFVNGETQASATTGAPSLTTTATAASPAGSYPITAAQGTLAAANYSFTFVSGTLTIGKSPTTMTLVFSGGSLVATVLPVAPATGAPTGTVQFLNGSTVFGSASLAAGTATTSAPPGTYTAVYSGDANFNTSSSGAATVFAPASSSLSLTSSMNPSALGQAVTFTATVSTSGGPPNAGAAAGAVQFLDGTKPLGSGSVSGGQATFTTSALAGGSHNIVAQYSGDGTWPAATASYGQTVNAAVTMSLTASPASPAFGQAVTLTANVGAANVPTGFAAPTGQVVFSTPGSNPLAPPTPIGTATLASGAASINVSTLAVGTQTITAQYSGDSTWSSASRQITVTVLPTPTATAISLTLASGQLTLTGVVAAVAPGSGAPTGSVQFVDTSSKAVVGSASLSSGKGSATVAASAASTVIGRPIEAVYSGDGNFASSTSAPLPSMINAAGNSSGNFAVDEIVSLFGIVGLNGNTAATLPLTTSLGGVTVNIMDSTGTGRLALLYGVFASAGQVNLVVPAGTAAGPAVVVITLPGGTTVTTVIQIAPIGPGIFTASANGQGMFAGQVIHAHADGSQTVDNETASLIDMSAPGDRVFLVLYGTGLRHAGALTATVNGVSVPVVYFGGQGSYPGMDQINVGPMPASLTGAGVVNVVITADGQAANTVTIGIQ
jgi:uncharacterized protein (TIGR03437 family)